MPTRPKVLFAVSRQLHPRLFSPQDLERLGATSTILPAPIPEVADEAFLKAHLPEADVVITSWGTQQLTGELLGCAPRLKLACHAAGSVRPIVSDTLWQRGIRVTTGAPAIAFGVAEFCLGLILIASKRTPWLANATREGLWAHTMSAFGGGFEIYQQNIGIIGAGFIGRQLIRLLKSFTCTIRVYDPYLSAEEAAKLDVEKVETLDELFATCRAVSLNAPTNEGTRHMLRGKHFAALQPGSLFINTAGSIQIHEEEFIAELRKGRFVACIDRCEVEPVQLDHPYRSLPNVLLSPHIAGASLENQLRIGTYVVDEIEAFTRDNSLIHEVTEKALAHMA